MRERLAYRRFRNRSFSDGAERAYIYSLSESLYVYVIRQSCLERALYVRLISKKKMRFDIAILNIERCLFVAHATSSSLDDEAQWPDGNSQARKRSICRAYVEDHRKERLPGC